MRRRNNRIHFYLSDDEYKCFQKKVALTGMSREAFIRKMINDVVIREAPPADYYRLIIQVRKLGSNINQLLKLANAKGLIIATDLRKALDENHKLAEKMWNIFTVE